MGKLIDLTGQRFGSLVVLERDLSNKKMRNGYVNVIADKLFQNMDMA